MGCGDEIIGSDGDKVVRKISTRYLLEGAISHGDVSLTILNIKKKDSGKYGCRIHVPGWFNDKMYYVHLIVDDGKQSLNAYSLQMLFCFLVWFGVCKIFLNKGIKVKYFL